MSVALVGREDGTLLASTVFSGVACIVGIGVITLPVLYAKTGWLGGTLILSLTGIYLFWGCELIFDSIAAVPLPSGRPTASYQDLSTRAFGKMGGGLVGAALYAEYALFLSVLILMLSDKLSNLTGLSQTACVWIIAAVLAPLTLMRSTASFKWVSFSGVLGSGLLCVLITIRGFTETGFPGDRVYFKFPGFFPLCVSLANIVLVFALGGLVPSIVEGMRQPNDFKKSLKIIFAISWFIYLLIGVAGYAGWGEEVLSDKFNLLKTIGTGSAVWQAAVSIAVLLIGLPQFAITALVVNQAVDMAVLFLINKRREHSNQSKPIVIGKTTHEDVTPKVLAGSPKAVVQTEPIPQTYENVARLMTLAFLAFIADTVSVLDLLIDIISSVTCVLVVAIIPVLIHWKLVARKGVPFHEPTSYHRLSIVVGCVAVGTVVMVAGTTQTVIDLINKE